MDKSPLKTLTLEDFLESERHKLTGTLTPVTPETFAKWKKERLDKKAAEEEARMAKEATGRAMFEKGDWGSDDDSEDEDDDDDDDDGEGEGEEGEGDEAWNMEQMRRETERAREEAERERIRGVGGQVRMEEGEEDARGEGVGDEGIGVKEMVMNGHS